jgi:hypothetical protein
MEDGLFKKFRRLSVDIPNAGGMWRNATIHIV